MATRDLTASAIDVGAAPSSQRMKLTLTLVPDAARSAALDVFLTGLATPSSPNYRQWMTPHQFAASYGATTDQIAAATAWIEGQGLSVEAVSPSGMRLSVSGFASQVEMAFATTLHQYQIGGHLYFANATQPSLPVEAAAWFSSIEGLDDLPIDAGVNGTPATLVNGVPTALSVAKLAEVVDANASAVMTIDATQGMGTPAASRAAAYAAVFKQAAAQGMTTLLTRRAESGGVPSTLPEVTTVAQTGDVADTQIPVAARPSWQVAPGLPADVLRHAPDVTASSFAALVQTVSSIASEMGGRLGNINSTLYELAPTPGLYTQAGDVAAGTWEAATGLGVVDTAKLAKAYPRGTGASALQIASSATSPTHGQSFVLTVTDTSTNGGGVPTGMVTFSSTQAGFTGSTATLNGSGVAQSPSYLLPGGTYTITVTYSGDANYAPASGTITVTVQPEAAIFTISAPATVSLGSTVTATVTLSSASGFGTPNASVTVTPSGITGAQAITQTISGAGSAQFTFTTKQAGSVSLQASCTSSDQSFTCYTPQTATTIVPQATPTVILSITPTSPTAGSSVSLQASVAGVAGIGATGTVQFFDGATSISSGSAPSATYSGTLTPGTHTLTAVYQGDNNYLKTTSNTVSPTVGLAPTTTTVSSSATTASYGQNITLNINVTSPNTVNGTQPTGTLTFTGAGGTTTATVSGGSANVTLSNLAVGKYIITTAYSGDSNYSGSTGNTVLLTVTQATASLNASLSTTSFTTGSTSTLTVTVTLPGNALLASGNTFVATIVGVTGATYTGPFTVNAGGNTGTGSITIPAPVAGTYTLEVTCGTNANFTCTPSNLTISSTAMGTTSTGTTVTTTVLTISPTMPAVGQSVVFTATVSAAASAVAATPIAGTVNFYSGTTLLGTGTIATVGANGVATATIALPSTTLTPSLTAVYQGNTVYASSTSAALTVTLSAAAAVVTLTSNVTTTIAGTSVVLTATVAGSTTTGAAPTGTVSFYLASPTLALIGTATVGPAGNGVGTAVFSTSNLPSGSLTIYATYNGDTNFSSAISNQIMLGLSDYTLSFVPQTLTLNAGQTGSTTAVITLINGFPGTVVLGCTPPPSTSMTCSFNPSVVTGGGPATLTVTTTAPSGHVIGGERASLGVVSGVTLAALGCWLIPGRRRRRLPVLLMVMLAVGLTFSAGCSANNFNSVTTAISGGTPLGTVLLNISTAGTSNGTTVRHAYSYQVTIQ
jgi:hypothetical protein